MFKLLFATTAVFSCALLTSCGNLVNGQNSGYSKIESDIAENKQQQELLRKEVADLSKGQQQAVDSIKSELSKTQSLIKQLSGNQNYDSGEDNSLPHQTKAQWLEEEGKILVGSTENITLQELGVTFPARIDTGATSSSLDARDIVRFERDGDSWVRFTLYINGKEHSELERPVVRWVRIFQSTNDEGDRRAVVNMSYKIGRYEGMDEFTLTDRSHLEYPSLIGRNIMKDRMIVDVSASYLLGKN